jgi:hypothetical protein
MVPKRAHNNSACVNANGCGALSSGPGNPCKDKAPARMLNGMLSAQVWPVRRKFVTYLIQLNFEPAQSAIQPRLAAPEKHDVQHNGGKDDRIRRKQIAQILHQIALRKYF